MTLFQQSNTIYDDHNKCLPDNRRYCPANAIYCSNATYTEICEHFLTCFKVFTIIPNPTQNKRFSQKYKSTCMMYLLTWLSHIIISRIPFSIMCSHVLEHVGTMPTLAINQSNIS